MVVFDSPLALLVAIVFGDLEVVLTMTFARVCPVVL